MLGNKVYEALPAVYIGSGLLNAALLDSPVKYLPSILFIGAGLLVMSWRWKARGRPPARSRGIPRQAQRRSAARAK